MPDIRCHSSSLSVGRHDFDRATERITGKRRHTSAHRSLKLCHFATEVITQINVFTGNMKRKNSSRHEFWVPHGSHNDEYTVFRNGLGGGHKYAGDY